MADYIEIKEPVIRSVSIVPNPVQTEHSYNISVTAEEVVTRVLYPLPFAAGEISAGVEA